MSLVRTAFYQPLDQADCEWFVEPGRGVLGRSTLRLLHCSSGDARRRIPDREERKIGVGLRATSSGTGREAARRRTTTGEGKGHRLHRRPRRCPPGDFGIGEMSPSAFESDTLDSWDFPSDRSVHGREGEVLAPDEGSRRVSKTIDACSSCERRTWHAASSAQVHDHCCGTRIGLSDRPSTAGAEHTTPSAACSTSPVSRRGELIGRSAGMLPESACVKPLRRPRGHAEAQHLHRHHRSKSGGAWLEGESFTLELHWSLAASLRTSPWTRFAGPFYLAWGHAEGGHDRVYLVVGRTIHKL